MNATAIYLFYSFLIVHCSPTLCQFQRLDHRAQNRLSTSLRNQNTNTKHEIFKVLKRMESTFWTNLANDFLNADVSKECKEDLDVIAPCLQKFLNQTNANSENCNEAAAKATLFMFDATAKIESGILNGRRLFNGLYSECAAIDEVIANRQRHLQGGYGRLFFDIELRDYANKNACHISSDGIDAWIYDFCLPKPCSENKDLLTLGRLVDINGSCPACMALSAHEQGRKTDYKTWITVAVLITVGISALIGSIYDYFFKEKYENTTTGKSKTVQCFVAFSIYTNISAIFSTANAHKAGQIGPIHFMRFASLVWIVMGHVFGAAPLIMTNPLDAMKIIRDWSTQILTNAFFAVDTFFFMSGLLVSYIWFKEFYRNKRRQMSAYAWIMFYVHRIIRLSPPYYLAVAFYTFVFLTFIKHMPNILFPIPDSCEQNWWINYLYLNNFIDYKNQCYLISWYLATDLQMYIFAPVILIPLAIKPLFGFISASVIFLASTAANMATIYEFYFPPSDFLIGTMDPRMQDLNQYTLLIYAAPWIRCQVYIIGMLTGYLLQTKKKLHINWALNIALWAVSLALGAAVVFCLKDWANGKLLNLTERALYSALSKVAWGLALSYITISCYYGYGGPVNQFMGWSIWIPLGRLTYSAYLIHYCIIYYFIGMSNVPFTFTNFSFTFVSMVLPITALTYFFAVFWSALIEISTGKLEMLFLGGARGRTPQSPSQGTSKDSAHENGLLPLPHLNSPSLPAHVEQEHPWNFQKPKKSLYEFLKRNEYKVFKPNEKSVPVQVAKDEKSKDDKQPTNQKTANYVAHGLATETSWEIPSTSKPGGRRRWKEHVDPMETPAINDWM
ncbi:Nose resistant to fluoxetine protein 6 [Toxocara canis]|uniref:Nose resistant to fluoxetine protein 6 n=1 Tax=Toxocara canis TaxID=6265 RepID=A0A0B2V5D8_TOXCA|nr:Nose resistant to fluoxetine protein 6 [Toxocara canis]